MGKDSLFISAAAKAEANQLLIDFASTYAIEYYVAFVFEVQDASGQITSPVPNPTTVTEYGKRIFSNSKLGGTRSLLLTIKIEDWIYSDTSVVRHFNTDFRMGQNTICENLGNTGDYTFLPFNEGYDVAFLSYVNNIIDMFEACIEDNEGHVSNGDGGNSPDGSLEEQRNLTGLDSLVYAVIVQKIQADQAVIDSLKEKMQPLIKEIEGIIENENFYPPRIRGKNDELIGEGISLHINIVDKPENVKNRLSASVKSIDEARNSLILLDMPIQELKLDIELLNELQEGTLFEEFTATIRNDNNLPQGITERIQYIDELLNQQIIKNED